MVSLPGSGSIAEIGYDVADSALYIRFRLEKALYRYDGVPANVWERFCAAPSKGAFHNRELRERYPWTEVIEG
jgi:hypothetical protein